MPSNATSPRLESLFPNVRMTRSISPLLEKKICIRDKSTRTQTIRPKSKCLKTHVGVFDTITGKTIDDKIKTLRIPNKSDLQMDDSRFNISEIIRENEELRDMNELYKKKISEIKYQNIKINEVEMLEKQILEMQCEKAEMRRDALLSDKEFLEKESLDSNLKNLESQIEEIKKSLDYFRYIKNGIHVLTELFGEVGIQQIIETGNENKEKEKEKEKDKDKLISFDEDDHLSEEGRKLIVIGKDISILSWRRYHSFNETLVSSEFDGNGGSIKGSMVSPYRQFQVIRLDLTDKQKTFSEIMNKLVLSSIDSSSLGSSSIPLSLFIIYYPKEGKYDYIESMETHSLKDIESFIRKKLVLGSISSFELLFSGDVSVKTEDRRYDVPSGNINHQKTFHSLILRYSPTIMIYRFFSKDALAIYSVLRVVNSDDDFRDLLRCLIFDMESGKFRTREKLENGTENMKRNLCISRSAEIEKYTMNLIYYSVQPNRKLSLFLRNNNVPKLNGEWSNEYVSFEGCICENRTLSVEGGSLFVVVLSIDSTGEYLKVAIYNPLSGISIPYSVVSMKQLVVALESEGFMVRENRDSVIGNVQQVINEQEEEEYRSFLLSILKNTVLRKAPNDDLDLQISMDEFRIIE